MEALWGRVQELEVEHALLTSLEIPPADGAAADEAAAERRVAAVVDALAEAHAAVDAATK